MGEPTLSEGELRFGDQAGQHRDRATVGEHIREARIRRGLPQADLARMLGTSQRHIAAIERDLQPPSLGQIHRLEELLGLPGGLLAASPPLELAAMPELSERVRDLYAALAVLQQVAEALGVAPRGELAPSRAGHTG